MTESEHASLDSLPPAAMARKAEQIGVTKCRMEALPLFLLAVLAGAFIALGSVFSTVVATGGGELPYGVLKLLTGLVFSLGLILVVVGGAELFTGNNLIVMARAAGRVTTGELLRNWGIVYAGNFVGAIATAALVHLSGFHGFAEGAVGETATRIAVVKLSLDFPQAICLGILCNALVCLAVWLSYSARTTTDRILAIVPPVAAFVAAGFEHSVANMYLLPAGLFAAGDQIPGGLNWGAIWLHNLLPVTIGNLIGGGVLVGLVYWGIYLRPRGDDATT